MTVKETVRNPLQNEPLTVPPGLQAQLEAGEVVVDVLAAHAVSVRIRADGGLRFTRYRPGTERPEGYWYEVGYEEGGPIELSAAAVARLGAVPAGPRTATFEAAFQMCACSDPTCDELAEALDAIGTKPGDRVRVTVTAVEAAL